MPLLPNDEIDENYDENEDNDDENDDHPFTKQTLPLPMIFTMMKIRLVWGKSVTL